MAAQVLRSIFEITATLEFVEDFRGRRRSERDPMKRPINKPVVSPHGVGQAAGR